MSASDSHKPQILHVESLARTRLFHIQQLELRFSNGREVTYERLLGTAAGAVLVVPLLDDQTLLLVREYGAGNERYELGLPKGRIEAGEAPLAAANREIQEEVGYAARDLTLLTELSLAPGYIGHTTQVVLARDLYPSRLPGDEPEPLEVVPWPLARLGELVARDDLTEARTIAALFLAREALAQERRA